MTLWRIVARHPLCAFFFLAYVISWVSWSPLVLSQTGLGYIPLEIPLAYIVVGSCGPLIAALLVRWILHRDLKAFHLWTSWKNSLLGLLIGFILIATAFILIPSAVLTRPFFRDWNWSAFLMYPYLTVHCIFLGAGPLGEEPGWRGFALPRLLDKFNPFTASLILGALWFCWHLPLFLLPTWTSSPMYVFCILVISLSFTMTLVYNITQGNVVIMILMHGIFNASPFILNDFLAHTESGEFISFELAFALSFLLLALALLLFTRGRLGYRVEEPAVPPGSRIRS